MNNSASIKLKTANEVCKLLQINTNTLRLWEEHFDQIQPKKMNGRRYFSDEDIELLEAVKVLIYERGYSIKEIKNFFITHGLDHVINLASNNFIRLDEVEDLDDETLSPRKITPSKSNTTPVKSIIHKIAHNFSPIKTIDSLDSEEGDDPEIIEEEVVVQTSESIESVAPIANLPRSIPTNLKTTLDALTLDLSNRKYSENYTETNHEVNKEPLFFDSNIKAEVEIDTTTTTLDKLKQTILQTVKQADNEKEAQLALKKINKSLLELQDVLKLADKDLKKAESLFFKRNGV